jgi:hypothetical protein
MCRLAIEYGVDEQGGNAISSTFHSTMLSPPKYSTLTQIKHLEEVERINSDKLLLLEAWPHVHAPPARTIDAPAVNNTKISITHALYCTSIQYL